MNSIGFRWYGSCDDSRVNKKRTRRRDSVTANSSGRDKAANVEEEEEIGAIIYEAVRRRRAKADGSFNGKVPSSGRLSS